MKSLAPCTHFTQEKTCDLGYTLWHLRCEQCQEYWSDWDDHYERMIPWLAIFGIDIRTALPPQDMPPERRQGLLKS